MKKRVTHRGRRGTDPALIDTVRQLARSGLGDADVARILNMHKLTTARGLPWTRDRVRNLRNAHRIPEAEPPPDKEDYLSLSEVASYLGISRSGVMALERMGAISRNQITHFAPWRVPRIEVDSERVQDLVKVLKETGRLPKGGCPEGQASLFDQK